MSSDPSSSPTSGRERALQLIASLRPSALSESSSLSLEDTPSSFAKVIVDLFPNWFDFGPDKFAILAWDQGLRFVLSGRNGDFATIATSDSRCMTCQYVGERMEEARMDMHYQPHPDQLDRARAVLQMALHALFPDQEALPEELAQMIPPGRVFPEKWEEFENRTGGEPPTRGELEEIITRDIKRIAKQSCLVGVDDHEWDITRISWTGEEWEGFRSLPGYCYVEAFEHSNPPHDFIYLVDVRSGTPEFVAGFEGDMDSFELTIFRAGAEELNLPDSVPRL